MTINWQRKHWIVFTILLVGQVFGLWVTLWRTGFHEGTLRVPLFLVPVWVIGSVFLTTLVVVPYGRKSALSLITFWLVCLVVGVLLWRLI